MKDEQKLQLQETRRLKLAELVDSLGTGGQKRLAEAISVAPDYVSRMLYPSGKKGKKGISGDMARKIEQKFAVGIGWLDGLIDNPRKHDAHEQGHVVYSTVQYFPLIDWKLPLTSAQKGTTPRVLLPALEECSVNAYWLEVRDDTMSGSAGANFPPGTLILVEPVSNELKPQNGDKVIAKSNGSDALTFKLYFNDAGFGWLRGILPGSPVLNAEEYTILGLVKGGWIR
jgi:SOS-response transcriptional repressor LexA